MRACVHASGQEYLVKKLALQEQQQQQDPRNRQGPSGRRVATACSRLVYLWTLSRLVVDAIPPSIVHAHTHTMTLWIHWFVLLFVVAIDAEILYKGCAAPADLGGYDKIGFLPNVCIQNHHFTNRRHAWFLRNSLVRNTVFTSCTFANERNARTNFHGVSWQSVTFRNCTFSGASRGSVLSFTQTSFHNVVFDECRFDTTADVLFSQFALRNVRFSKCSFASRVQLELGDLRAVKFEDSRFFNGSHKRSDVQVLLSKVSVHGLRLVRLHGRAALRVQQAVAERITMSNASLASFSCHEHLDDRAAEAQLKVELSSTVMEGVKFSDGVYCDQTMFDSLEVRNVQVRRYMMLRRSQVSNMDVSNVSSYSNETRSVFDLSNSIVRGRRLEGLETNEITFARTLFPLSIFLKGSQLSTARIDVTDAVFSQERVNAECCTVACALRGCKCDVSLEPTFCPRGNSSVNVNVKDSCFPGDSTVQVVMHDDDTRRRTVRMSELRVGQRAMDGANGNDSASAVYFFGHASAHSVGVYVVVSTRAGARLALSEGHTIEVARRGLIAARDLRVGDRLLAANGDRVAVTAITRELREGMYAPTTSSGQIVVNGIVVTCYTESVRFDVAHALLAPLRAVFGDGAWTGAMAMARGFARVWKWTERTDTRWNAIDF